jgi:hypothetical protein
MLLEVKVAVAALRHARNIRSVYLLEQELQICTRVPEEGTERLALDQHLPSQAKAPSDPGQCHRQQSRITDRHLEQ